MTAASGEFSEREVAVQAAKIFLRFEQKMAFLKSQISALENLSQFPIIAVSIFLLKSQFIEFELKQLITEIDLHLAISNSSQVIRRKTLKPIEMDDWTLGRIRLHLLTYNSKMLAKLQQELKKLVILRNMFAHKLFSVSSDIDSLARNSEKAVFLANKVISEINIVKKNLEENDPLRARVKSKMVKV